MPVNTYIPLLISSASVLHSVGSGVGSGVADGVCRYNCRGVGWVGDGKTTVVCSEKPSAQPHSISNRAKHTNISNLCFPFKTTILYITFFFFVISFNGTNIIGNFFVNIIYEG